MKKISFNETLDFNTTLNVKIMINANSTDLVPRKVKKAHKSVIGSM